MNIVPIQIRNLTYSSSDCDGRDTFSVPSIEMFPKHFPFGTLSVQRALCVISQKAPGKLAPVIGVLFHAAWVEGSTDIGKPDHFAPVIEGILGKQGTLEIMSAMNNPDAKALLAADTARSFNLGAFGLPWFESARTLKARPRASGVLITWAKWLIFRVWIVPSTKDLAAL
ncbi:HCCA isomerase/glutathione S-transferase kappa [Penicillium cf. griseofulvum]|nr:HCCA isomerase/glutathione S-transferase kappa [Penicillium cf. griseofulvum]